MSAQDHLNPKLFHSSPHLFKKGELVKPGVPGAISLGGVAKQPHAYTTSDPVMATDIAERTANNNGGWINEVETAHDMSNVFEHLKSTGFTGDHDPLLPHWRHHYANEYASPTGFVATGRATFISPNSKKNASTPEGRD